MNVYILWVERSSIFQKDSYIDSVYFTETSAWNRIEKKVKELTETIVKLKSLNISFEEFIGKSFILAYQSDFGICYNRYCIIEQKVK